MPKDLKEPRIYIGKICSAVTAEEIQTAFKEFGKVKRFSKGDKFAIIEYHTKYEAA